MSLQTEAARNKVTKQSAKQPSLTRYPRLCVTDHLNEYTWSTFSEMLLIYLNQLTTSLKDIYLTHPSNES